MALVSLVVIASTIKTVRETGQSLNDNLTFHASQLEYETMQLLDHLDRFQEGEPEIAQQQVQVRFDILWSRTHQGQQSTFIGIDPATLEIEAAANEAYMRVLSEIEPGIARITRADAATIREIKSQLRSLVPQARQLRIAAKDSRANAQTSFNRSQLTQTYLIFGFIVGLAFFGILAILLLRSDRSMIQQMNLQLEDRVRQRTEDLQAANRRLAAEIAERKRNQDLAAEREARLEQAVQLARLGYYVWDSVEDRCEFCSGQYAASFGLSQSEFVRQASGREDVLQLIHAEDREQLRDTYEQLRNGHIIDTSYRVLTSSGVRRLREVARPIFDDAGALIREVGSTVDVTDQYETEMKLFEAQKMDSIGKMTGGVAHDFNNLLAVVLGNLELLKEQPDSADRDEMISDAIAATLRGRDLTMSMLSFARRAPLDPADLNLNEIIAEMQGMLRRTLPETISFDVDLAEGLWTVAADRSLTESTLLNLVINARDAMPSGGRLTIRTNNLMLQPGQIDENRDEIEPGHYVMMTVADTGKGIQKELIDSIFEPFFTTKAITKNSGLGLSMVQGFVKQTGGTIRVASEPGMGTTFRIYFKANQATVSDAPAPSAGPHCTPGRALRVLLVEDDETVRKVLSRQLQQSGLVVVEAAESASAESAFAAQGPFDVVVSDVVMPGELQGPALLKRLRQTDETLPAVLLSGYPQEARAHQDGARAEDVMVMKPVGKDDLLAAINAAIQPPA